MSDNGLKAKIKAEANDREMKRKAREVAEIVRVTKGAVGAPTEQEVYDDLAMNLLALDRYPDVEATHGGIVILRRQPGNPNVFTVLIPAGTLFIMEDQ